MLYIKIPTSFFDNDKLKALRSQKDGNNIVLLYVMLIVTAIKSNSDGLLLLCEDIPYDYKILSGILGIDEKTVKDGLDLLVKFGFLDAIDNVYSIVDYDEFADKKGAKVRKQGAERQAKFRAKESDVNVTDSVTKSAKKLPKAVSDEQV